MCSRKILLAVDKHYAEWEQVISLVSSPYKFAADTYTILCLKEKNNILSIILTNICFDDIIITDKNFRLYVSYLLEYGLSILLVKVKYKQSHLIIGHSIEGND